MVEGSPIPRLRLLGYYSSRPHLRLIRLPECQVEPSPVPVNRASSALDRCVRREGWIAFHAQEVWGVPIPLEGKAFQVGPTFSCIASQNERAIWMDAPVQPEELRTYVEYDGVAREVTDERSLPKYGHLEADVPAGLVIVEPDNALSLWERGASERVPLDLDAVGPPGWLCVSEAPECFYRADGTPVRSALPIEGTPQAWSSSFSPDGSYAAVDIDVSGPRAIPSMIDIVQGRAKYTPKPHRLALIECSTGDVTIADGVFDNFASAPVWSHDSEWLVFCAPFQRGGIWACRTGEARLERIRLPKATPVPLVNVTDLIPD